MRGLSPEITFSVTPCSAKYAKVSLASGRTWSSSITRATARTPSGRDSPSSGSSVDARSSTRRPLSAASDTGDSIASNPLPSTTISGAPNTHVPCPSKEDALHLRADEKATEPLIVQAAVSSNRRCSASCVAFGLGSDHASAASAASISGCVWPAPSTARTSVTSIAPDVIVPVLSRQITSTRARTSIAGSSWTSVRRFARRSTPTVKATLVSRIRPSGTMATTPPTAETRPSRTPPSESSWLMKSAMPVGTSAYVTRVTMRSIVARNALCTSVKRRASSASCAA